MLLQAYNNSLNGNSPASYGRGTIQSPAGRRIARYTVNHILVFIVSVEHRSLRGQAGNEKSD